MFSRKKDPMWLTFPAREGERLKVNKMKMQLPKTEKQKYFHEL